MQTKTITLYNQINEKNAEWQQTTKQVMGLSLPEWARSGALGGLEEKYFEDLSKLEGMVDVLGITDEQCEELSTKPYETQRAANIEYGRQLHSIYLTEVVESLIGQTDS